MANFAELDENNIVKNVLIVDDSVLVGVDGNLTEQKGIDFLTEITGHNRWVQTFTNNTERKNLAGVGYIYDELKNAFICPKPLGYDSFVLNEETCVYEPTTIKPDDSVVRYYWSEPQLSWVADNNYERDQETNQWRLKS